MRVTAKSTMGGTNTQNFVQNGMLIPPSKVSASIEKNIKESNKKIIFSLLRIKKRSLGLALPKMLSFLDIRVDDNIHPGAELLHL
jgi:hypothetical protein